MPGITAPYSRAASECPGYEEELAEVVRNVGQRIRDSVRTEGVGRAVRTAHGKSYGLVKATVRILEAPRAYAQGIFAQPRSFDGVVRYSNGLGRLRADSLLGGACGMGIKISRPENRPPQVRWRGWRYGTCRAAAGARAGRSTGRRRQMGQDAAHLVHDLPGFQLVRAVAQFPRRPSDDRGQHDHPYPAHATPLVHLQEPGVSPPTHGPIAAAARRSPPGRRPPRAACRYVGSPRLPPGRPSLPPRRGRWGLPPRGCAPRPAPLPSCAPVPPGTPPTAPGTALSCHRSARRGCPRERRSAPRSR